MTEKICLQKNLNSIMILLIRKSRFRNCKPLFQFKFHYDSINSDETDQAISKLDLFKFHYDSINSHLCNMP